MKTLIVIFMLGFPFFSLGQNLVGDKKELVIMYCDEMGYEKLSSGLCSKDFNDSIVYKESEKFTIVYYFNSFEYCVKTVIIQRNEYEANSTFAGEISMWENRTDTEVTPVKEGYTKLKLKEDVYFIKPMGNKIITLNSDAYIKELYFK